MTSKIELERFRLTSSRPFDEVLASIKGAVGHPDMVEFIFFSRKEHLMPMIDVYTAAGTFVDKNKLAQDLANAVMKWEGVPSTDLFKKNTAAFVHELPSDAISNAAGDNNYVRVQVLTPVNVLNREKQVGVVRELTDIVAAAAGDRTLANRTWVLITESPDGGWGINGQAFTNADIVASARAELGNSQGTKGS